MSTSKFVLVTGATGQQGGAVVQALLAKGHRVRGLTRNAQSASAARLAAQGVDVAAGDFTDQDSLVRAATGIDTIFAMSTPFEQGMEAETAQGLAITDAAKQAGVGHLVYSSVASADRETGIPHFDSKYAVEKAIRASGVPHTIIAPVFFMDNFLQPWMGLDLAAGTLSMAMPGTRALQQIAVADIGAFATAVIERRDTVFGQRFDIAGDELTGEETAVVFSKVTGHTIRYQGFSPDAMRAHSEDMAIMFEWFDTTGYVVNIAGLRNDFADVAWHDLEEWAQKQNWNVLDPSLSEAGG